MSFINEPSVSTDVALRVPLNTPASFNSFTSSDTSRETGDKIALFNEFLKEVCIKLEKLLLEEGEE
jgi:hypothetical protein